jgi:hypothetical protein
MSAKSLPAARPLSWPSAAATVKCLLVTIILLGALSGVASGYTLVMRNGRRVEVPARFALSDKTLTYEAAPGMNVTLLLAVVDIAATERANNEPRGSFLKHAEQDRQTLAEVKTQRAQVTVTNRELEPARRARISSELAYEKRRRELGLPSIEESRRRQAEGEDSMLAMARRREAQEANTEAYWRERAAALRAEVISVDAQIGYLRSRMPEGNQFPLATHSLVTSVLPLVPLWSQSAVVPSGPINPWQRPFRLARPIRGFGFPYGFPNSSIPGFGAPGPFDYVEDSYQRAKLQERLDDLLVTRAGLSARWLELENEARAAKVPQVWLEPY